MLIDPDKYDVALADKQGRPLIVVRRGRSGTDPILLDRVGSRQEGLVSVAAAAVVMDVGPEDASFEVCGNVGVTVSGAAYNFNIFCTYTDEQNVARTLLITLQLVNGSVLTNVQNGASTVPYHFNRVGLRAKAGTKISVVPNGTFTNVTYNFEARIERVQTF